MVIQDSPLEQAMAANGTEAGPEPPAMGVDEWLRRLTELPLAFQPGEGWRYHQSFAVLGILISRVTGRPLGEHLAEDVSGPLGMTDTALWVADGKLDRLPAAYRHGDEGLVEIEPAGGVSTQGRRSTSATANSSPPHGTITDSPGCLPKEDESTGSR
jgi:CubicO group peptidase (beta-lactamase class C family)